MFDFYLGLPHMDVQVQLGSVCCFSVVSLVWLARMRERDASTSSTSWSQEQTQKWEVIGIQMMKVVLLLYSVWNITPV